MSSIGQDRRQFLVTALPLVFGTMSVHGTSPPPVMPDELKPIKTDEVLPLPAGATKRLGSPRLRVHGYVNKLQFSPKGTTLVAASGSELRGWDPPTGKVTFRVGYPVNASVDAGRLTSKDTFALLVRSNTGGKYEIQHYAFGTGKLIAKSPPLDINQTQQTAFSVDGALLLVVRQEGLILYEADTGKEKWREGLPAEAVGGCVIFDDKSMVALATKGEVKLFATATGKLTSTLQIGTKDAKEGGAPGNRGKDWLQDPVVSSDGRWLAVSVGEENDSVCCWDVKTGKIAHRLKPAAKPLAFTPTGKELLTYKNGKATFWNLADGKPRHIEVPIDDDLVLSPDGKILAAVGGDGAILIDPETGKHLSHSSDPPGIPETLRFQGSRLIGRLSQWGGWIEWDILSGAGTLHRPTGVAGLSPVGLSVNREAALYRREDSYRLHDMRSGRELAKLENGSGAPGSRGGNESATLTADGRTIVAWKPENLVVSEVGQPKFSVIARAGVTEMVSVLATSSDSRVAAIGLNRNGPKSAVDLFDLKERKFVRRLELDGDAGALSFSPDGEWLAVGHDQTDTTGRFGRRTSATVFDLVSGKPIFGVPPDEHNEHIIAMSADGRMLARVEGNNDSTTAKIAIWEVLASAVRMRCEAGGSVRAIAFSADGRTFAASIQGAPVFLWDLHGGPRPPAPGRANLETAWTELLNSDSAKAFAAVKLLAAHPDCSIPFLRDVIGPVTPPDETKVAKLIADLDHKEFRKREQSTRELATLGERARGALRQASAGPLSPETRERIERLLSAEDRPSPEYIRQMRAIEAIEVAGGPESLKLLEHWGSGAAGTMFTRGAQSAAKRLKVRMAE